MKPICIFLLSLCFAGCAWAQSDTQAAIVGTATDQSGAVVRNATVTATDIATGIAVTTSTDDKGNYRFSLLDPGTYNLSVHAAGFNHTDVQGIVLNVGEVHRTDLNMKVGSANETINVSSTAAQINTETAERGDVVTTQDIEHLPLNGRQFLSLAALEPGAVSGNPKRGVEQSYGVDVSFNGARGGYNSYYMDGAANTDPLYNTLQASPSIDAISEFRVSTNMYSAQYGQAGGAVVSIVTKSGTNAFHGTAYDYLRNKALDALPYFYSGERDKLANYLLNQYGGTIGGPIIKNRTFFFFSTEFLHQQTPGTQLVGFAPTALERQGNVSQSINPWSGQPDQLINPYTGAAIPGNILPSSMISPIGQKLMDMWPQPNYSDPFLNYRVFVGGLNTQRKFLGRVDHRLTEKDNLSGTFDYDNYDNGTFYFTQYGAKELAQHNRTVAGSWTHTFSPILVNDFKSSYAWFLDGDQFQLANKNYCASWGFAPSVNTVPGTCRILFYTIGYQRFDIGGDGNFVHWNKTYYAKDNLIWAKGRHSLMFGGDFTRNNYKWQYEGGLTAYYFGLLDGDPNYGTGLNQYYGVTGSTFTDVLMAIPNHMYVGIGGSGGPLNMPMVRNVIGAYVQDDWKVKPRLTLNLGLRYDYEQPFANTDGEYMSFDYKTGLPVYAKGAPAALLSTVAFKYETNGPNRPFEPHTKNFSPRFGFAWRPFNDNRTAVRGGYGIFYTTENAFDTMYGSWVAPFQGLVYSTPSCPSCWPDGQRHLTTVDQVPYGLDYLRGSSPGYFEPNSPYYPAGYVQQWNLTVAHDLGGQWAAEIGYVGTTGTNLDGPSVLQAIASPNVYNIAVANGFSNFGVQAKGFGSHYDALQATLRKSYSHGLRILANYTWSHAITDASNDSANENLITNTNANGNVIQKIWSNADFDVRNRLSVSGTYELPFGRGKAFGSSWNRVLNGVLGGWRSNLIYTYQTGFPFTVYMSNLELPDQTCSGVLPRGLRTPTKWFDYSCFPTHNPTTITNPVTGNPEQINLQGDARPNSIPGPPTNDVDYGMEKYFHITERQTFQFRGEAFNLFNHANLIGPSGNYFFNSASGAEITQARNAREIQVSLRYSF